MQIHLIILALLVALCSAHQSVEDKIIGAQTGETIRTEAIKRVYDYWHDVASKKPLGLGQLPQQMVIAPPGNLNNASRATKCTKVSFSFVMQDGMCLK